MFDEGYPIAVACHHDGDEFATVDSEARIDEMGIYLYPTLIPDGQPEPTYPYSYDQLVGVINDRLAIPAPCTISVAGSLVNDELTVNVTVTQDAGAQMPNARVQVVVTEIDIPYPDPNYNNEMNFVNRDMILDHTGTVLTFTGNTAEVSVSGMLDPTWTQENLIIVVWVEDGSTLEVYQATREDIEIFLTDPNAPAIPTEFVTTPDPTGTLSCDLSWTNPSLDFSGNPLTELLEMRLYRDGDLIYTDSNPTIGGAGSYTDVLSDPGLYNYMILGYNSFGEGGPGAVATTWVGEDVPNVVDDLLLVDQGGNGYLTWTNPTTSLNGGAFNEPILGYHIVRSDGVPAFEVTGIATSFLDDTIPGEDYYNYEIIAYNSVGDGGIATSNTVWIGEAFSGIVIIDIDPTPTGAILQASIENFYGGSVVVANDINAYPLTSEVDAVFILLGIYSSNYVLTEAEVQPFIDYVNNGGCGYIEGGDVWYFDPLYGEGYDFGPLFGINPLVDGSADLSTVNGDDFLEGMSWSYSGENNFIDQLAPIAPAVTIFSNPTVVYDCGIAYDSGTYKTVGTSFEITGLGGTNTLDDAVGGILDFFDVTVGAESDLIPVTATSLNKNYPNPFNPDTNISYSIKDAGKVAIEVYNIRGQLVKTLVNEIKETGNYTVTWNGRNNSNKPVASGVYFYKMKVGKFVSTKKMILMK